MSFSGLVETVFRTQVRWSPSFATSLGIHEYDHLLSDPSRDQVEREVGQQRAWLEEVERFPATGLTPAQRVDRETLRYALRLALFHATELRQWERNPDLAMDLLDHLFALVVRDTTPLDSRLRAIAARLEGAPEFLERGRGRLGSMPRLWIEMAAESARAAPDTLSAVQALAGKASAGTREGVARACKLAEEALAIHAEWLDAALRGTRSVEDGWAIGAARFSELVELRMLGMTSEEIRARGQALVREKEAELRRAAEDVIRQGGARPGADPVREAGAILARDHPATFPDVLQAYRDAVARARAFVGVKAIASLPDDDRLEVIETPAYLRHVIPFAAYFHPAKFEPVQLGVYMVTPRPVEQFPTADILNTTVHEGYPGHHLQLTMANRNPSLARLLVAATETIEGWAHYCEELMFRHGFASGPSVRFVQRKDQLWRACRIVIDHGIHAGGMSFEDGVRTLVGKTGMPEDGARAELKRYTQSPGYQLSYLLGKILIGEMRDAALASGMGERSFHDRLLAAGSLPIALLRHEVSRTPEA